MPTSGFQRFKFSSRGYRQVMKGSDMEADLQRRADKVKAAAEAALGDPDIEIIADTNVGKNRAGATVIGVPMRTEASDRVLGRAIDAAK